MFQRRLRHKTDRGKALVNELLIDREGISLLLNLCSLLKENGRCLYPGRLPIRYDSLRCTGIALCILQVRKELYPWDDSSCSVSLWPLVW
jgi:hypothetical protein